MILGTNIARTHIHDYRRTTDHMTSDNQFSSSYPISISSIPSSYLGEDLVWAHIAKPIGYVETLMLLHKYNQIPVFDRDQPRSTDLRGIVTWQSIARARVGRGEPSLADALVEYPPVVDKDLDLFTAIPMMLEKEIVLVRDEGRIDGLITLYDLTKYLADRSELFFVLAEIEVLLRRIVKTYIGEGALSQHRESDTWIKKLDDLGMDDCKRILEQDEHWKQLGINHDRVIVVNAIDRARKLRNSLMHGRPSEMVASDMADIGRHRNLLDYLRLLARPPRNWDGIAKSD